MDQFQRVVAWSGRTQFGDMAELAALPDDSPLVPLVTSTVDNCLGSECPFWDDCFVVQARQRAQAADIVVVNHHLLLADLALKQEGFGVLTDIDVAATMKAKLGEDFRPYRILGACNPQLAHRALLLEDKIGTMLPCNVIVQQHKGGGVEVSAIDPVASMQAIKNPGLAEVADEVQAKLKRVVDSL